jgi:hypothetical protein
VGADLKGAPVIRAAYGMADLEHDTPITLDTIFEAGSVSKQFTAAAVLLLVREGKLSLDDPIRKYYFSDEIETALDVAADGSRLVIRRRPDFTAALTPVYADGFNSGALGWVVFRRDGSGRVDGFSISQDRMWALAFTRQP